VGRAFVIEFDEPSRRHLLDALARHSRWLRERGYRMPSTLAALALQLAAQAGQPWPQGDDDAVGDDDRERELLDYETAGKVLSVSGRTVRRLVAADRLATVRIGGRRLVPRQAIVAFVERETA
jgi:excisionase family DNA binding protein